MFGGKGTSHAGQERMFPVVECQESKLQVTNITRRVNLVSFEINMLKSRNVHKVHAFSLL